MKGTTNPKQETHFLKMMLLSNVLLRFLSNTKSFAEIDCFLTTVDLNGAVSFLLFYQIFNTLRVDLNKKILSCDTAKENKAQQLC